MTRKRCLPTAIFVILLIAACVPRSQTSPTPVRFTNDDGQPSLFCFAEYGSPEWAEISNTIAELHAIFDDDISFLQGNMQLTGSAFSWYREFNITEFPTCIILDSTGQEQYRFVGNLEIISIAAALRELQPHP